MMQNQPDKTPGLRQDFVQSIFNSSLRVSVFTKPSSEELKRNRTKSCWSRVRKIGNLGKYCRPCFGLLVVLRLQRGRSAQLTEVATSHKATRTLLTTQSPHKVAAKQQNLLQERRCVVVVVSGVVVSGSHQLLQARSDQLTINPSAHSGLYE